MEDTPPQQEQAAADPRRLPEDPAEAVRVLLQRMTGRITLPTQSAGLLFQQSRELTEALGALTTAYAVAAAGDRLGHIQGALEDIADSLRKLSGRE